jgi:hypothetical protein
MGRFTGIQDLGTRERQADFRLSSFYLETERALVKQGPFS